MLRNKIMQIGLTLFTLGLGMIILGLIPDARQHTLSYFGDNVVWYLLFFGFATMLPHELIHYAFAKHYGYKPQLGILWWLKIIPCPCINFKGSEIIYKTARRNILTVLLAPQLMTGAFVFGALILYNSALLYPLVFLGIVSLATGSLDLAEAITLFLEEPTK